VTSRRRRRTFFYGIFLIAALVPAAAAAPRLKIEPPAKEVAPDESVVLKIRLEWPQAEGPYELNSLEPKLENLTLENQNQSQETGETISQTFRYEFRPLKTGLAFIYPFEISYRKIETDPWIPLLIPEHKIKVVPRLPFRGIVIWLGIAAGLSASILAGFKLWENLKMRAATRSRPPQDPKQRLYAKAEESISTFTSPDSKEKLAHWSNQLRAVIATYYDIPSGSASSSEILSFLKARELPTGERNEISRLFDELTELQFSRQDLPACDLERMQKTLLQYVRGKIIIGKLAY
jgi:hypothetical protein